ncbi:MAG: DUF1997 domain-containing protein [Cyanobacteriota bacterium]|nr:DUF1997 domain-containing protein [Cyanobacteriota bacterium]
MLVRFTASQSVEIPIPEQKVPIEHYLRQPRRLVNALVEPSRLEQLSEDCFRLKMRTLKFLSLSIQPTVDMRVRASSRGTIYLRSLGCEIRGIEYIDRRFSLNLAGILECRQINGETYLKGHADLQVEVELPPPLQLTPKPIIESTGNGVLKSVLLTIKQRLTHHLLEDYLQWASDESEGLVEKQEGPVFSTNG